jgi:hypothetical protein
MDERVQDIVPLMRDLEDFPIIWSMADRTSRGHAVKIRIRSQCRPTIRDCRFTMRDHDPLPT